jgi:hypothetical protein
MNRDAAKKQMRIEMTDDLPTEKLDQPMQVLGGLTPNQVMDEVDQGSEVGERFLTDYVVHNAAGGPLDETTRNHIVVLMESDLKSRPDFADEPWIRNPDGGMLSPNQMIQQIKNGTDLGNLYADAWMGSYGRYINLDNLVAKANKNSN